MTVLSLIHLFWTALGQRKKSKYLCNLPIFLLCWHNLFDAWMSLPAMNDASSWSHVGMTAALHILTNFFAAKNKYEQRSMTNIAGLLKVLFIYPRHKRFKLLDFIFKKVSIKNAHIKVSFKNGLRKGTTHIVFEKDHDLYQKFSFIWLQICCFLSKNWHKTGQLKD